jgi:hypothetical protein
VAPAKRPNRTSALTVDELKAFYADDRKATFAPRAAMRTEEAATRHTRDPVEIHRTVASHQKAFQLCIERELKKNPAISGGRIHILATLAASGEVTAAKIDRVDVENSDLGRCLRNRARRMTFPVDEEDADAELEIPLILGQP